MIEQRAERLRLAVVGAGLIGRRHIELIRASGRAELVGIADPTAAASAHAEAIQVPYFDSLEGLIERANPDGVILATPTNLHSEQTLTCLAQGTAVLVEKPATHDISAGLAVLAVASRPGQPPVLVGHNRRYSSVVQRACEIVRSGALGRIVAVVGTTLFYKAESEGYFTVAPWRTRPGGGPILLNLIHEIDTMRAICGPISAVHATVSSAVRHFEVEDTAAICLQFANGALGTFLLSDTAASDRSWEHTTGEDPRYVQAHVEDVDCYHIAGTEGSLSLPTLRVARYPDRDNRSWHRPMVRSMGARKHTDPMEAQLSHFCDVIEGTSAPRVPLEDGIANVQVVDAILRSARTGARCLIG